MLNDLLKDNKSHNLNDIVQAQKFDPELSSYKSSILANAKIEKYSLLPTQFLYIWDLQIGEHVYVSSGIKNLLGYDPDYFTVSALLNLYHPDDFPISVQKAKDAFSYLLTLDGDEKKNFTFSLEYRIRRLDGKYIKVNRQSFIISTDVNGNAVHICSIITELSSGALLKSETEYINLDSNKPNKSINLSKRELEILKLLAEGKTSNEIANLLFISFHTVEKHRKNMLFNNSAKNTLELIKFAKENLII